MINIRFFRNALVLAEFGNFARAAESLNISQPTLTRSIQMLEKSLDQILFNRETKGVTPTQAGEIVLKHARLIIASSEAMQEEIARHRGIFEGSVNIGSGPFAGTALLSAVIGRFNQRFPEIEIKTSVGDWTSLPERLMRKEFDFVLMESSQLDLSRDFDLIELNRHQGFIYCRPGHPLLEQNDLVISDLARYPLMFPVFPDRLSKLFIGLFFPAGVKGSPSRQLKHILSDDLALTKSTVLQSDSISVATFGILEQELKAGLFTTLPFRIPALNSGYDIIKRRGLSLTPTAIAFIEILIEIDKKQSVSEVDLVESLGPVIEG